MTSNRQAFGLKVASVVFGLASLAQLVRIVLHVSVVVAGHPVPFVGSGVAVVVLGFLSFWTCRLSRADAG